MKTDNRLIAEFMGVKPNQMDDTFYLNDSPFWYCNEKTAEKVMDAYVEYSKYHTSWDWIMPVSQKIERIIFQKKEEFGYRSDSLSSNDIEVRYMAVVKFIKWYNNLKTDNDGNV